MDEEEIDQITSLPKLFNVSEILQDLLEESLKKKDATRKACSVPPSEYMNQLSMTTDERTEYLVKSKYKYNFLPVSKFDDECFEITPGIVIFQQFTPGNVYNVLVTCRNITQIRNNLSKFYEKAVKQNLLPSLLKKVPRYLKTSCEIDPFFFVEHRGTCYSMMLAPGLANTYNVQFVPEKKRDYNYLLKFLTNSGEINVPVIAIGPRPILDFPDRIEMPLTAVKISSMKTIFVRNIGSNLAVFTIYSKNPRIRVEPSRGRIEEEENLQFTVYYLSDKSGDFEGKLHLEYETGEKLGIDLCCSVQNCSIRIDRGSVRMEETYLGLSRSKLLTIHNRSDYVVKYKWMLLKDADADNQRREEYKRLYHLVYENELVRCIDLEHYNICTPDVHQLVYQRIYTDEIESLTNETFQYNHLCFSLVPEEGEIWPQTSTDFTVLFQAVDVGEINSIAYLEVTGREDRIPLSLHGIGRGPLLQLNVITINLDNIYLCSEHNYEVIAANKGHISGTLVHRPKATDFGGAIQVTPSVLKLKPGEHKTFNLSFRSKRKGDFVERVDFVVKESLEVLSLHIKGCIVCPTLHFDKEILKFGDTALGFTTKQEVNLKNLSFVPVAFTIAVQNDGHQEPLTYEDFAKLQRKPSLPSNPREFLVIPEEGVVSAQESQKIKVIFTPNIKRTGRTMIQVDIWDSDTDPLLLPIKYSASIASFRIVPPQITIPLCFINFPYTRSLSVENTSSLSGYFYLLPQQVTEDTPVICSLSAYQGVVKAGKSKKINLTIITKVLGNRMITLNMLVMGETSPNISCTITCTGYGPTVYAVPSSLDFDDVHVLEEKIMNFTLTNDSLIPAYFKMSLGKKNSPWKVSPESGDLIPNSSINISVKLFLRDAGKYSETITVNVVNGQVIRVKLNANGFGCSIVFEPHIFPVFCWGLLFSHQKISRTIILRNHGTRNYQIIWTTEPEVKLNRGQVVLPGKSKFRVEPLQLDVPAGGINVVNCELLWKTNECVQESWYVFGYVQGGKRELIDVSTIKVTLTEPQILFSKKELTFRVDICPDDDKLHQKEELLVTNKSKLNLNVQLSVNPPFYLLTNKEEHVQNLRIILLDEATTKIHLYFSIDEKQSNRRSCKYTKLLRFQYDEHPNQDKIVCNGFVNFPNLVLEPKDIVINCELGSSAEKILTLTNNGPVSVLYKFLWIADSIRIERYTHSICECKAQQTELPISDVRAASITNEEICISNREDGSGDGPQQSIRQPANSPSSEIQREQKNEISNGDDKSERSDLVTSTSEMRNFLMPLVIDYFKENIDLPALECLNSEPQESDYINQVLNIVPFEGTIPPYSVHHVYIGFHGFERLQIKVAVTCNIFRGPSEEIKIYARSDIIQYSIDTEIIDFGQQLFLKSSRRSFTLKNKCNISFEYKINDLILASEETVDHFDINSLRVEPNMGFVDAQSFVEFNVEHRPTILGPIDHQFKLEIGHLMPVTITVKAYGTFPQVYPCIPQGSSHPAHTVELEYSAIQSLTLDYIVNKLENDSENCSETRRKNDLFEEDINQLMLEEWSIISYDEICPRVMDIDMIIERCLAKKLIDSNSYILMQHSTTREKAPIPNLFSTEYLIDMKYVIVQQTAHYSTAIINYGPWNVDMRLKNLRKTSLAKSGIVLQFKKHANLKLGDYAVLHVIWHASRDKYTEKRTNVKHTIYIEVIRGCTIPITIKGIVTYPYVTVDTRFLDFDDVVVGQCLMMCIVIRNEGLVDCQWETKLSGIRKKQQEECQFYIQNNRNHCSPGHAEVVHIFFKPRKTCYAEAKLKIIVEKSLETPIIELTGRGIEKSLNITESTIEILPMVPFTEAQDIIFSIENTCQYPVEFFWHHLESSYPAEDYVANVLNYYYQTKEILLPLRKPGEAMPQRLIKFYNDLVDRMARSFLPDEFEEEELTESKYQHEKERSENQDTRSENQKQSRSSMLKKKIKKQAGRSTRRSTSSKTIIRRYSHRGRRNDNVNDVASINTERNDGRSFSILDETLAESVSLPTNDPEEIQRLLFDNIDSLHKNPDFCDTKEDPVKEVFESIERESILSNNLPERSRLEKKVCIIFHGAPFTGTLSQYIPDIHELQKYQETACKSAEVLEIPVLVIDNAITETIALGSGPCSLQLGQAINEAYTNYIDAFEKYKACIDLEGSPTSDTIDSATTVTESNRSGNRRKEAILSTRKKSPRSNTPARSKRSQRSEEEKEMQKSNKTDVSDAQKHAILHLRSELNPLNEFNKIPPIERLEILDPLSRYEYKIQAILNLQKILDYNMTSKSPRDNSQAKSTERSTKGKEGKTFLGLDYDLLVQALEERLSKEDFKRGFVLQRLESIFLGDNCTDTLLVLLRNVGHVEYFLFVTFINSMTEYNQRVEELRREIEEKTYDRSKKIQDIDEMSLSEYDLLLDDDKKMYLEAILPSRKEETSRRRAEFAKRMMERRKKQDVHEHVSSLKKSKGKGDRKSRKAGETGNKKSTRSGTRSSKQGTSKATKSRESSRQRKEGNPSGFGEIMTAMNRYYSELSVMEDIIRNWDPIKKAVDVPATVKSRVPRSAKSKDVGTSDTAKEIPLNKFHIWYVKSSDPWKKTMYDAIVAQMQENWTAKSVLFEPAVEPDLRPKIYSVLSQKNIPRRSRQIYGNVYQLMSITSKPEVSSNIELTNVSEEMVQENRKESQKEMKKRGRKSASKSEEQRSTSKVESLNTSTIESRNTSKISISETMMEMPLKPQWILAPKEIQRFKIRFQPEETGIYEETYALTIVDGNSDTYELKIVGIADIPRLDMNPGTIFTKIAETKVNNVDGPTYFLDSGIYDLGSILILRKDKTPHCREAELQFCNVSKVDAEVHFSLTKNNPGCFSIESESLLIPTGISKSVTVSAIATKLGTISERLYLCIKNNPKVETIELQSEGSRLNIELSERDLSFGRVLLYRREFRVLIVRNRTPVEIFWCIDNEDAPEFQITFTPAQDAIKPWDEQKIEFCYHATKVGVIEKKQMLFKAFLHKEDEDPIFMDTISLSGETYDVAIDINYANPIDLKCIKVDVPAIAIFMIKNRGDYEVKYVITLEDDERLTKMNFATNMKKILEISPTSGSIPAHKETTVKMSITPKRELNLEEAPILKCNLVDTHKETVLIAEIPLTVSLFSYYTRFRVYPYPSVDFGSLAICTEKTMYLNIENTGKFPLEYTINIPPKHPSVLYMNQAGKDPISKKKSRTGKRTGRSRKNKTSARSEKSDIEDFDTLTVGPMTISKSQGTVNVAETDTIAIKCYPEVVGSLEEEIIILVTDTFPKDRNKIVSLRAKSSLPTIDFTDFDSIFRENHLVEQIQDFKCPREIGAHTVFARQEKCLYFRCVNVLNTHTTYFKLYNRNIVSAEVEVFFLSESLMPSTAKSDTFIVEPRHECIPAMNHKTFTVSFTPSTIETFTGTFDAVVSLPAHLEDEVLSVKLIGESCVPEVAIIEPIHGKRERANLNFGRTLVNESNCRHFALENIGFIKAKIILEIDEDRHNVFKFSACPESEKYLQVWDDCLESNDKCTVVRLVPGNVARFEVTYLPTEIRSYSAKIRLFVMHNPYENLTISLEGESYSEPIVFEGLELEENRRKISTSNRNSIHKGRRTTSRQNSLASASLSSGLLPSLTYTLDYGLCFVGKMYKKTFRVTNKSTNRWFRFQWSVHPNVVFVPSIGHVKYLTCKEIVATFFVPEPQIVNTHIECTVYEIEIANSSGTVVWDDRQTEVQWKNLFVEASYEPNNKESFAKKTVQPTTETNHEIVPGTSKCIQVLLNATVAFSEYSCPVQEIYFKDTLMFQTREYTFTLSNPGIVNTVYSWKIDMDEQYPKRHLESVSSRPRTAEDSRSRPNSKSLKRILSATSALSQRSIEKNKRSGGDIAYVFSRPCTPSRSGTIEVQPTSSTRPSDLFSSTAGLSERTTDSWLEGDDLPFAVYPELGFIPPQQSVECTLKFSPMDVFYYKAYLTCKIENLDPNVPQLTIPVAARSLLPYCHFDVQESDYISSGRRDPKLPGPVGYEAGDSTFWGDIRVIEFKVIGVGKTHVKNFHLINPTMDDYHFSWKDRTARSVSDISNFHCTVLEGIAERGKRTDLAFTFLAEDIGVFESFWLFSIERYNLECLFLVVGIVTEPSVHCPTVHVKLKPTILEYSVRDCTKLLNNEDFEIPFEIIKESLYSEGKFQKITVSPMSGSLVPRTEQLLWVEYHPTRVGEFHFSIQCSVKLMKSPLTIFVTASVYDIVSSVSYCNTKREIVQASENEENVIDVGKLMLNSPNVINFDISNPGKISFYYSWDLNMTPEIIARNVYSITTPQRRGHVASEDRSACSIILTTFRQTIIKDHSVTLQITNGPVYRFLVKATSKKPEVEFSFDSYNFGPCYIQENTALFYYAQLTVKNSDNVPFIIECKFEEKPHLSLDLSYLSEALAANSITTIPIIFRPLKEMKYEECLVFTINSTNEKKITITGEGIVYKIRLVNPRDKSIDLGSVPAKKTVLKRIPVVNEGLAAVDLKFGLMTYLSDYEKYRKREGPCTTKDPIEQETIIAHASVMETKRSGTRDTMLQTGEPILSEVLQIEPSSNIVLRPNKRINVTVTFKPTSRIRPFVNKVAVQTSSTILPLFVVRGSCVGAAFQLNRTHFSFGTVVEGCFKEVALILMNTGDIGARFKWNTSKMPAGCKITPMSGYCSPGMDVNFVVKFQPSQQSSLIEGEAIVEIEKYESLMVKISGGCCKLPEPTQTIFFTSIVRKKEAHSVNVTNDTNYQWKLKPEVTGSYFSVQEVLQIFPKSSSSCTVTYSPLVMNTENTLHMGTLILKLPNEEPPILYSLRGRSLPPEAVAKISRKLPAKTKYTELLPVYNWLDRQQRFNCQIELRPDNLQSQFPLFNFIGNNKIDVPPNNQRDYRAVFYSYDQSKFNFKVTFTNEDNEYQFYEIEYDVNEAEVIESIKLTTTVRSQVCHILKLENPLESNSIMYMAEYQNPFITVKEMPKIVSPLSHEFIRIQYSPILPSEETVVILDINCQELGHFPYELRLKATPSPPEKVTRVSAILGTSSAFSLSVKNYSEQKAEFIIEVDNDCFACQKSIVVPELINGTISVLYEPSDIENITATLTVSSKIAGEYIFPLIGTCSLPKPMGPYTITRKSSATIPFKNIFKQEEAFEFLIDIPEVFAIETETTTLKSKQSLNIKVSLLEDEHEENPEEEKYPVTGKLQVYCTNPCFSHVNWVYYLRGVYE